MSVSTPAPGTLRHRPRGYGGGGCVKALETLAPEAEQAGVRLCVENHFGTMTQTAADTAALVREIAQPSVRVLYDQANLTFTHDEKFEEAFAVQGDLIGHVHVKDLVFTDPNAAFRATETARVNASERAVRSRVVGSGVVPWPQSSPRCCDTATTTC